MTNLLEYDEYYGSVSYSSEDHVFFGKIEFINDLVTFEATDVKGLEQAFTDAVDDYKNQCQKLNRPPQKSLTGRISIKINPALHKKARLMAARQHVSLNKLVENALSNEVDKFV